MTSPSTGLRIRIKICGIREPEHALVAAESGADYIGMIFYEKAARYVPPEQAREIVRAVRAAGHPTQLVGVFVNEEPARMADVTNICSLDLLQLSGDEPWDLCGSLPAPANKVIRVLPGTCVDDVVEELDRELPAHAGRGGICMLESRVEGHYGGTGQRVDWALAAVTAKRHPFLLSGGLDPDNVGEAVRQVRPWGVDVSSGIETGGRKDPEKIRAFIEAVRDADAGL